MVLLNILSPKTYFIQGQNTEKVPPAPPSRDLEWERNRHPGGWAHSGRPAPGGAAADRCARGPQRVPAALPRSRAGKESRERIHCSNLILLKRKHTKIMYKKN